MESLNDFTCTEGAPVNPFVVRLVGFTTHRIWPVSVAIAYTSPSLSATYITLAASDESARIDHRRTAGHRPAQRHRRIFSQARNRINAKR